MIPAGDIPEVFSDLSPIPQNDGPDRVCTIQYPSAFSLAYNYMRAVWAVKEKSERALKLTATCLKFNPANYTVWNYRRQCLQFLGLTSVKAAVQKDLDLAAALGGSNPKNYQIWYHRRALLEAHGASAFLREELEYISNVLDEDSKNYHAWSYRQWILMTVDDEAAWAEELEFASTLIRQDIRNNSAWNQRWFVSHRAKAQLLTLEAARGEADFALGEDGAKQDPYNESPWRYLIGIMKEQQRANTNDAFHDLVVEYEAKAKALESKLANANRDPDTCVDMTSARVDLLEMIGTKDSLNTAITLAEGLANDHDTVRTKYWSLVLDRLRNKEKLLTDT
eukprot:CAMPEP_0116129334 /NCGR_PEP_ID=MMETSP0329-20121206/7871_1 /TAXON_ID=697910 /ORGANISM="Pseudo-nitzschia arenysensis, Strain B593" /LENGTH=336 /DNA_ID=CAMNT_0003623599 /DNA_START=264 /DNA_END=1274 /DNA_ORIENTATION=-